PGIRGWKRGKPINPVRPSRGISWTACACSLQRVATPPWRKIGALRQGYIICLPIREVRRCILSESEPQSKLRGGHIMMKAIRIHAYGGPEQLRYEDAPVPQAGKGQVLV